MIKQMGNFAYKISQVRAKSFMLYGIELCGFTEDLVQTIHLN